MKVQGALEKALVRVGVDVDAGDGRVRATDLVAERWGTDQGENGRVELVLAGGTPLGEECLGEIRVRHQGACGHAQTLADPSAVSDRAQGRQGPAGL